jgi:hypothetical protein
LVDEVKTALQRVNRIHRKSSRMSGEKVLGYKLLDESSVNIESNPCIFESFQIKLAGVVMTFGHGMIDEGIDGGWVV